MRRPSLNLNTALASMLLGCQPSAPFGPADAGFLAPRAAVLAVTRTVNDPDLHVHLDAEVARAAHLTVAAVRLGRAQETMELLGEVSADPDATALVVARAPGRVLTVQFREGDVVRAGQLLLVLESPELARARGAVTVARARAAAAQRQAARLAALHSEGLAGVHEHAQAVAEANVLAAEQHAAVQQLQALGETGDASTDGVGAGARLQVRSPLGGVVLQRSAVVGQSVAVNDILGTVVNLRDAVFSVRVFERDLARLKPGAPVMVTLTAHPGVQLSGVVSVVGRQVDPATRTVVARVAVRDTGGVLRVGLSGVAQVAVDTEPAAGMTVEQPIIPAAAVVDLEGRPTVFVMVDGGYAARVVRLGQSAGGVTEVSAGLRVGDLVVVDGAQSLRGAVLIRSLSEQE